MEHGGSPPKNQLGGIADPKDRINEYHLRVNERRKKIHERQLAKKREQEDLSKSVLAQGTSGGASSSLKKSKKGKGAAEDDNDHVDELEEERIRQEAHLVANKKKKSKGKKGAEKL